MKGMITALAAIGAAAGMAAMASAASPGAGPQRTDAQEFEAKCALCHGKVGTGTMMLERRLGKDSSVLAQRTDLQGGYVEAVVRHGIGSMPAITRVEVTDAQLAAIIRHLTRNNAPTGTGARQ